MNDRTRKFAVDSINFAKRLDCVPVVRWVARQLVRSATSVAANQRAARRARSDRELAAKLSIIVEESDESAFWFGLLRDLDLPSQLHSELSRLQSEAGQLVAIYSKGRKTMRQRLERS